MKANEIPEKIYLYPYSTDGIYEVETKPLEGTVEYTRTDAFIEKTEEFFYSALNDGIMGTCDIEDFIKCFRKYMEK